METIDTTCSYFSFESMEIICAHILKVFHHEWVNYIPSQYIIKRWTIHSKKGLNNDRHNIGEVWKENKVEPEAVKVFVSRIKGRVYDLVICSKDHVCTRDMLSNAFEDQGNKINEYFCSEDLKI